MTEKTQKSVMKGSHSSLMTLSIMYLFIIVRDHDIIHML